jgi:hypothetical protein
MVFTIRRLNKNIVIRFHGGEPAIGFRPGRRIAQVYPGIYLAIFVSS